MFEIVIPWAYYRGNNFTISVLVGDRTLDPVNDEVDVEVKFDNGERYGATFCTVDRIRYLMDYWKDQQLYWGKQGLYFYCPDLIVIREITLNCILETVEHLMQEGEFEQAFQKLERVVIDDEEEEPEVGSSDIT